MDEELELLIKKVYSSPKSAGNFSSAKILKKTLENKHGVSVPLKLVQKWLKNQQSFYLHRPRKVHFSRNPTYVKEMDEQWQADLLFLPDLKEFNKGMGIIMVVIDVMSRYAWVNPMREKKGEESARAFASILKKAHPRKPKKLHTDDGTEFFNTEFGKLMKENNIQHFSTKSDLKAAVAERFVKTIKEKIYKYLTASESNEFLTVLPDLVHSYNNTYHSSIGMAPAQVRKCNTGKVLWNLFHRIWSKDRGKTHQDIKVGDHVRISDSKKHPFTKGYKGLWTKEIFKVDKIKNSLPEKIYKLVDLNGEPIIGGFYHCELQLADSPENKEFWDVDSYLQQRNVYKDTKKGKVFSHKEYLVKWVGYPDSFNEWVHEKDLNTENIE